MATLRGSSRDISFALPKWGTLISERSFCYVDYYRFFRLCYITFALTRSTVCQNWQFEYCESLNVLFDINNGEFFFFFF